MPQTARIRAWLACCCLLAGPVVAWGQTGSMGQMGGVPYDPYRPAYAAPPPTTGAQVPPAGYPAPSAGFPPSGAPTAAPPPGYLPPPPGYALPPGYPAPSPGYSGPGYAGPGYAAPNGGGPGSGPELLPPAQNPLQPAPGPGYDPAWDHGYPLYEGVSPGPMPPPITLDQESVQLDEEEVEAATVYQWYQPGHYFDPDIWDGSFQVGVNGSDGNSQTLTINAGYDLKRETERIVFSSDLKYANGRAGSKLVQHFAILNVGMEWKLPESRWSVFTKGQLQFDELQAYDARLVLNGGLAYRLIDTELTKFKVRAGAGVSREIGGPTDEWVPEANFGYDFSHKIGDRHSLTAKIDYYPSIHDFRDYRLVTDVGWEILLDEISNLSLKIGYVDRIDSTPAAGKRPSDSNYVLLLLWKL